MATGEVVKNAAVHAFSSLLAELIPVFEPISPRFISFFLRRKLKEWKNEGLIESYRARTKRIGKLHHRIYVDLDLTPEQANRILKKYVDPWIKRIRR
jgi:hypothetical protein